MSAEAARLEAVICQFVPQGFRDDDGVWHDGPLQDEALAELRSLEAQRESWERTSRLYETIAANAGLL